MIVDLERCESHGECVIAAPEVFQGFDDDSVLEFDPEPGDERRADVQRAAAMCPVQAISLEP